MKIAVLGISCTKFGELWDKSLQDLLAEAQLKALQDAQINASQIDAIFTGNMCAGMFSGQLHLGAMATEILNINCPSITVEGACGSGGLALRQGILAIESGSAQVVLVNGVEKMSDLNSMQISTGLMAAANEQEEHFIGATFPGINALVAKSYMHEFNLTRNQLSHVSIKNHKHGSLNPLAHFQREITLETVSNSQMVADPLTVFDCPPISDGAASIILSSESFAKKHIQQKPVYIIGSGQSTDSLVLSKRESFTEFKATQLAAQKAYKMAKAKPENIDLVELHDGFTILEIITLEDLGFYKKGNAGIATQNGETMLNAKISVNPSGGLKAKGHPVGATGISQAYEVVKQLRNEAKNNQVKNAKIGLTHNMGGCGTTSVVHIFSVE
jgi:acetyl-CoA C-acetyltransferase